MLIKKIFRAFVIALYYTLHVRFDIGITVYRCVLFLWCTCNAVTVVKYCDRFQRVYDLTLHRKKNMFSKTH